MTPHSQQQLLEAFTEVYDGRIADPMLEHPLVYEEAVVALGRSMMIVVPIDLITSECLLEFKKHGPPKFSMEKVKSILKINGYKTNQLDLKGLELTSNKTPVRYETVVPTKDCLECEGEGCITCSECGNTTYCFDCGGEGELKIVGAIPYKTACFTKIKININDIEVCVDKRMLDVVMPALKYFAGHNWKISIKHKLEKIVFVNSIGVRVLLMPCKDEE